MRIGRMAEFSAKPVVCDAALVIGHPPVPAFAASELVLSDSPSNAANGYKLLE